MTNHDSCGASAKRALFCATMLGGLVAAAAAAASPVLPTGGVVRAGSATVGAPSGGSLTVSQTSSKAIVDWSSFSIGQGGTVQFDNGSGATLNRVTGANISAIDGLLSATGSVYLINPNGVIVGKTGVVNTGGSFVASTLGVANSSFLAGGPLTFSGPSTASVVNLGKVSSLGGSVAMIAATVENDGSIAAPQGTVGLIAGTTVTMDDADNDADGLFSVQVGDGSTSATNTGAIAAAAVELRAQQGNVYALAGNTGGVINATGVDTSGGVIKLISTGGTTTVTGTLSAQGANGTGGQIETSGETLDLGAATVNTHGGSWLLDPTNLIINATAASAIDSGLASGSVTLMTSATGAPTSTGANPNANATNDTAAGAGDIVVASPITWSTGSTLTLNAYAALIIDAPITVTGAGKVVLDFNTAAADATGGLSFDLGPTGFAGSLSYGVGTGEGIAGQALTVNGASYTLLYSTTDLTAIGSSGDYAVAAPITRTGTADYPGTVAASFSGTLEGLGNTISGLKIVANWCYTCRQPPDPDVGLINVLNSGGLVRDIGLVGGSAYGGSAVGELVGLINSGGTVASSYATGSVSGWDTDGGLVGVNSGTIETSYATGAVFEVIGSATGAGDIGGLVGSNSGTIKDSYATGALSTDDSFYGNVGGLVGGNSGTIEASYATGATSGGSAIGGLVGASNGTIETSYATGTVSGSSDVGGLVGLNSGSVETSYATGDVSGSSDVGGLVGAILNAGAVSNSYWDVDTTGQSTSAGSAASYGLTTAQLQSNYDGYMSVLGAEFGGGTGGLYPYLLNFFPDGVQVVSGFAYSDGGLTPMAETRVSLIGNGASFETVISGANGYYYAFAPAGTLTGGQTLLAYGFNFAATLTTTTGGTLQTAVNLYGMALTATTNDVLYSQARADVTAAMISAANGNGDALAVIADSPTAHFTATGASFTIDESASLLGDDFFIETTAANAPITVAKPITVSGSAELELDASGSLFIDAPITVTGAGKVTLGFDTAATDSPGGLSFDLGPRGFGGSLTFAPTETGQALTINGEPYTLLYSMSDVAAMTATGDYALAAPISATGTTYTSAVVGSFSGTLEGLGNTITGLTISEPTANTDVGLIGTMGGGLVRDLGLVGGTVSGNRGVGDLVGYAEGVVDASYATGKVSGSDYVGGLVGVSHGGTVDASYATGAVSASDYAGGLVGWNESGTGGAGTVESSYATGAVSGSYTVGGLVGENRGTIESSDATGAVSGSYTLGGLVGYNSGGTVETSYATGAVSGSGYVGGLVGFNNLGSAGTPNYDTGGLVEWSYATGAVSGSGAVGGLVGENRSTVETSYATGAVSGARYVGGLVGLDTGAVSSSYWDIDTTGQMSSAGSAGTYGLTTAQLQSNSGGYMSNLNSGGTYFAGGTGGLYPYLLNFFPDGVQVVSGFAYSNAGVTPLSGTTAGVISDGLPFATVSSGVNGYYYAFAAAGTLAGGQGLLADDAGDAATLTTTTGATLQTGVNLYGQALSATTSDVLYSQALTDVKAAMTTAADGNSAALAAIAGATGVDLTATGASFTIDAPVTTSGAFVIDTTAANAPITVAKAITIGGSGDLALDATGSLSIDAPIAFTGGGQAALAFAPGALSFDLGPKGFGGSLSYAVGTGEGISGQTLTINGTPYTLLYSMSDVAAMTATGDYALAAPISAIGTTYTGAVLSYFSGTLEGLGDSITGLTIADGAGSKVGLIGKLTTGGLVRDLSLVGGSVTGLDDVGDLAGFNQGAIIDVIATGAVSAPGGDYIGGLVGDNAAGGVITDAIASGASVSASGGVAVGGLVGYNSATVGGSSASDLVGSGAGGTDTGGLVGYNAAGATISFSAASGAVSGGAQYTGGLAGYNGGVVGTSFATGAVSGGNNVGGLAGRNVGTISDSYWDVDTTGQSAAETGATGLTTAQLQSNAGGYMSNLGAAFGGGTGGLYPYLKTFFPNGVQAISGFAPTGGTVAADVAGVGLGSVGVGANGYYYEAATAGTISGSGSAVIAYSSGANGGARVNTLTGTTTGFDILPSTLISVTPHTSWSSASATSLQTQDPALIAAAEGSDATAKSLVSGLTNYGYIATSFTINVAPSLADGLYVETTAAGGTLTVAATAGALTLPGANDLYLLSSDALIVDVPIKVTGAGQVTLGFDTASANAPGGLSFAFTGPSFADSLSYAVGTGEGISGQTLTINGTPYTLLYSMSDVAAMTATGDYALAAPISATGTTYTGAVLSYFSGTLEGLGDSITGLTIADGAGSKVGLIGKLTTGGLVRDLSLVGGSVTGLDDVGDLAGFNQGAIIDVIATGAVSAPGGDYIGGLVGDNAAGGVITDAIASGASVSASGGVAVGGLVGYNSATVGGSSASDLVGSGAGGTDTGGLVGYNAAGATISSSAASGAVSGGAQYTGGLAGYNGGVVGTSFATGAVSGGSNVGGLAGRNVGTVSNSYWDVDTTGQSAAETGATGLTTAQLQSNAGGYMSNLGAAFGGGTGGLYPYLKTFFPNGVQAIVGSATSGGAAAAAALAGIYYGGAELGGGAVSTGANGYIYLAVPTGTLGASGDKIGADITLSGGSSPTGLVYTAAGAVASNVLTLPTLAAGQNVQTTSEITLSALQSDLSSTFGASTYTGLETVLASTPLTITATGSGFTVNQAMSVTGLTIQSAGALAIDSPISVAGAGKVALTYGAGGLSFDLGPTGFAGSLSYAVGTGEGIAGQALTINGSAYKLLYSMPDVAAATGAADYALATSITATGTYSSALIGYFSGTLEGLGNSVSGLTIADGAGSKVGLIGKLNSGATVRDLGLTGGSVTGLDEVGDLAGLSQGSIIDVIATGAVSAPGGDYVGGLVGENVGGAITGAIVSGATVSASGGVGVGGLVGYSSGSVSDSSSSDVVNSGASGADAGGLVGYNTAGATISSSWASGGVTGLNGVGGLVGLNDGTISNTYAYAGAVTGKTDVGGLVGDNDGGLATSWSSGSVDGSSVVGGSIGLQSGGALSDVYWDEGTSGKTLGVGSGTSTGVGGIGGTTGLSPDAQATYAGFNFSTVWTIKPGTSRAYLQNNAPATPPN